MVNEDISLTAIEVVEELTEEEIADRNRLELKVERAFYEAGLALRELRDRRLYRSSHRTFEEYSRNKFGFTRFSAYNKIAAAEVVENLLTNGQQILPTNERQCRELAKLEPDQQPLAWREACSRSQRVPPASTLKDVVQEIKQRNAILPPNPYSKGEVVKIHPRSKPKYKGCWGIILQVNSDSCMVHLSLRDVTVQCKLGEMDKVDPKDAAQITTVSERIAALTKLDLDPVIWSILETLSRQISFTQIQLNSLAWAEEQYGISPLESKTTQLTDSGSDT